ncbi:MAG: MG2 domain-containing protein, partial [Bacteroidota bacterium]|nr:MG2 domain-containing protein [Bacteroidota bacterium]
MEITRMCALLRKVKISLLSIHLNVRLATPALRFSGSLLCLWFAFFNLNQAFSQNDSLQSITRKFNQYSEQTLPEKLFLHLDRPLYLAGETLWFKIYAVDGTFHKPLPLSKIAYVEVLDKEQKPVLQGKIALAEATGQGSFVLPTSFASGNYLVRAYTNWMKNFSPDYYFQSAVTIVNTFTHSGIKPVKDSAVYDVQFFPEGGNLVKGITSIIAFKITDKFGRGLDSEGSVQDKQGKVIASFKTLNFGLGHFAFTPTEADKYKAIIKLPNNKTITQTLPAVFEQGYVMHLEDASPEQIKIIVQTNFTRQTPEEVFLLGHARQKLFIAMGNHLNN